MSQQALLSGLDCLHAALPASVRQSPLRVRAAQARVEHRVRLRTRSRQACGCAAAAPAEAPATAPAPFQEPQVELEVLPGTKRRITVTVPARLCKQAWQRTISQTRKSKDIKVDGFRDMKNVPEPQLIRFLGGQLGAKAAAVETLIKNLPKEVKAYTQDAISESIKPELTDEIVAGFEVDKPFTYQIRYDVHPTLNWKSSYKGLKVEVVATGDDNTDQANVQREIRQVLKRKGDLRVVQGRGFQVGDTAVVDFDAARADTGEVFSGAKRVKTQLDSDSADMQFLPGLAERMVGMEAGESRDLTIKLPEEFEPAALRGVDVACTVKVSELFSYDLPELDDSMAEEVAPGCGGAAGLRSLLLRKQQAATAQANQQAVEEAVMAAVTNIADCSVPEVMVKDMAQNEYQARLLQAQARGQMSLEQVKQLASISGLQGFTQNKYAEMEDMVKCQLAMSTISAAEGLKISEAEFEAEYQSVVAEFGEKEAEFDDAKLREQVTETLQATKIVKWLKENCEIVMLPPLTAGIAAGA